MSTDLLKHNVALSLGIEVEFLESMEAEELRNKIALI